ncbi:secondary thiamine-phosphate synthase enzyme YjbQ [Treponema zuelzerae]|uniref:Secondary thiamine-phosphate synthase enzyme YjbQ n=1 Tax=Teretinema zuelzerae TaxID=156 RepID=A0AAE3ELK2_9SPIR|nr:secondary thiamine-phosphate synthase enzyme YjbQ [Teretinema zuelzerae]MBN2810733.1 YjbQ family protein [Spirochaetales bacterium]MCD1655923.1 secondary thiamine-phosphate synthase enzyme YjbQ [Teretinema zuelzerae]
MLYEFTINTEREGMTNLTNQVYEAVRESGIQDGFCIVYCPHTTAGITINENADPDVVHDVLLGLSRAFPDTGDFLHAEGNSAAHLKSSCIGSSVTLLVQNGELLMGRWQGVYFCEFDGPRKRTFFVKVH